MIWHPLIVAVVGMDFLTLVLIVAAVPTAWQIAVRWAPQSAERFQLRLETQAETAAILVRFGQVVFLLSSGVLILGVCLVLPALAAGAMCGTGVLEATDGLGGRALVLRFLTAGTLIVWWVLDRLNRTQPLAPLTETNARVVLAVLPFLLLSVLGTFEAVSRLEGHPPVVCCAVVYDQLPTLSPAPVVSDSLLVWGWGWATTGVLACGLLTWRSQSPLRGGVVLLLALISVVWAVLAASALTRVFSGYYYQVLNHHCPWCLFLPQHGFVGFLFFGVLVLVLLEAAIAWITDRVARKYPDLAASALTRSRAAGLRIVIATLVFGGLAGIPPLLWRLRFGVWMG